MESNYKFSNKLLFIKNYVYTFFKGILIGFKCILLLYLTFSLSCIKSDINFLILFCTSGLINGFIDALIILQERIKINKILLIIIGIISTFFVFSLSLYFYLPHILVDYFIYGEGGGGVEPGGWFAFNIDILFYLGTSLIISFPMAILIKK